MSPSSLFSASFWLSLYAVSIIFLVIWRFSNQLKSPSPILMWLKSLLLIQVSLSLLMIPLVAMINYQVSFISLFANLVAVPLMSLTSIPLCLLAVLLLPLSEITSYILFELALKSITLVWQWFEMLALHPWSIIEISNGQMIGVVLTFFITAFSLFLSVSWRYIMMLVIAISMIIVPPLLSKEKNRNWQVNVMDVGQGLSVIIERNQRAIIYDTGASYPSGFNLVDAVVMPYLRHQGIITLDKVIISHSDNDHAGGLKNLQELINIDEIIANDNKLGGERSCLQGESFEWQQLTFSMLSPDTKRGEENDDSCVIRISDGKFSVLLTGDISSNIERALLHNEKINSQLRADILVAPHHGSKTSSSPEFVKHVSPKVVVFSAGFLNRWKMPMKKVVERYQDNQVKVFNTAENGMVRLDINNSGIHVKPYKQDIFPYWFAN